MTTRKAIISVIGAHGNDTVDQIIATKREDVAKCGFALWMNCSLKSIPILAQGFLSGESEAECLFVAASGASKSNPYGNARPAKGSKIAVMYSANRLDWIPMPRGMSPVSGHIPSPLAHALVIDSLDYAVDRAVDLRYWAEPDGNSPLMLTQYASTACCLKMDAEMIGAMRSHGRKVIAVARLREPFSVYLKA